MDKYAYGGLVLFVIYISPVIIGPILYWKEHGKLAGQKKQEAARDAFYNQIIIKRLAGGKK